jgi:hypothetical protein
MGKAHKRTVKITRASSQCSKSGSISIRDRYPGIGSVSILNGSRFIYFASCHKSQIFYPFGLQNCQILRKCLILKLKTICITVEQIMKILT